LVRVPVLSEQITEVSPRVSTEGSLLTSVFLKEGVKRGLDASIVNPLFYQDLKEFPSEDIEKAERVIFRRDLDAFQELEGTPLLLP